MTTTALNNGVLGTGITLPIDYTSRDYLSIRTNLINAIPNYVPEWTDTSSNDFGIALTELFAYTGDILNYYIDRMANEAFLGSAQQRQSVLNAAYLIDYFPSDATAAVAGLTIGIRPGSPATILAAGTQFATASTPVAPAITFETQVAYNLPANATAGTILVSADDTLSVPNAFGTVTPTLIQATQGITVSGESVGTSTGLASQTFTLFNTGVIGGSITVLVNEGNGFQVWAEIPSLAEAGPADSVWTMGIDANGVVYINFGSGANGRIPDASSAIIATYRVGGGAASNVGANTIVVTLDPTLTQIASVTNPVAAQGGADPETIAQIQANAPQSLTALNRCVSLNDYAVVALELPAITKAAATSSYSASVQLYVHPVGGPYDPITLQTLISDPIVGLSTDLTNVNGTGWLDTRKPAGTTVTVLPPEYDGAVGYVPIFIIVNVQVLPTFTAAQVAQNVTTALVSLLDFGTMGFGQLITESSVWHAVQGLPGVDWLTLGGLYRGDAGNGIGNVQCASYEIPTVGTALANNITVNTSGGL